MTGSSPADLVGHSVDDYDVVSRLGGGGMGVVYEAKAKDGRRVAIKTLKAAFMNDKELVGRFLGEARALKAISHRAMVEILSIGQLDDGTHYMVMEFLEGRSFEDVIEHGAPLDVREVMTWMVEVLDALETVHAAGVIHRDLKPSNLFLARTGIGPQVKLIDFGIAKHTGKSGRDAPKTLVSAIVGTPDYMSPEQVNGQEVTAASDLYALGCVMFEMLTGDLPFDEESSVRKMLMHVEQPAPRVSSRVNVPEAIDDIVTWTMQKDPAARPATARLLKERILSVMGEALGGGAGPAVTRQVKAVPALREEKTMLANMTDLHHPPTVTEPSMPALTDVGRVPAGRAVTTPGTLVSSLEPSAERTVIGQGWPVTSLVEPATAIIDRVTMMEPRTTEIGPLVTEDASAPPVRVRRRTEPVPRQPGQIAVPIWALAAAGAAVLVLVLVVIWKLTRPHELPPGPVTPVATPTQNAPANGSPENPSVEPTPNTEPVVASPPDRPVPKRKKTLPPTRKKPTKRR